MEINSKIIQKAKVIWEYMLLHHEMKPVDLIIGLGSHDVRTAERCVELYKEGISKKILFTGGVGRISSKINTKPEAQVYADLAMDRGVPTKNILIEDRSGNTGENIQFSKELLDQKGWKVRSAVLVNKPYMERRSYAAFRAQWPELDILVTSSSIGFEAYCEYNIGMEKVICLIVGDLERIRIYPEKGYQIPQIIPKNVENAFEYLVNEGFTECLP